MKKKYGRRERVQRTGKKEREGENAKARDREIESGQTVRVCSLC